VKNIQIAITVPVANGDVGRIVFERQNVSKGVLGPQSLMKLKVRLLLIVSDSILARTKSKDWITSIWSKSMITTWLPFHS